MTVTDPDTEPTVVVDPVSWQQHAACKGIDTELFFPARGATFEVRDAKAVCAGCTVREVCLDWALDHSEAWGIWGGKSERERRRLRVRRRAERRAAELAAAPARVPA